MNTIMDLNITQLKEIVGGATAIEYGDIIQLYAKSGAFPEAARTDPTQLRELGGFIHDIVKA